jgi:ribosome-associated protein
MKKKATTKKAKATATAKAGGSKRSAAKKTLARRGPARAAKGPTGRRGPAPKRPQRRDGVPASAPVASAAVVAAAPAAAPGPDPARPTAVAIAHAGLDKKAEDVTVLDVRGLTSYADYFVVMTADSDRQASAIADAVEDTMKKQGVSKVGVEGYDTGRWILVDYGDVVAHVMSRESRGFYDLEGLWADAPRFRVEG